MRPALAVILTHPLCAIGTESFETTEQTGLLQQLHRGQLSTLQGARKALAQLAETAKTLVCTGATPEVQKFSGDSLKAIKDEVFPAMLSEHNADKEYMDKKLKHFEKLEEDCKAEFELAKQSESTVVVASNKHKECRKEQMDKCKKCELCTEELALCWQISNDTYGHCDSNWEECHATSPESCDGCGGDWGRCKDPSGAEPKCTDHVETIKFGSFSKQVTKSSNCQWEAKTWAESYLKECTLWWEAKENCTDPEPICTKKCEESADFHCDDEQAELEAASCGTLASHDLAETSCSKLWEEAVDDYKTEKQRILKRADERKQECHVLEGTECLLKHIEVTPAELGPGKPCNGTIESCSNFTNKCERFDLEIPDPPQPPTGPPPPLSPCTPDYLAKHGYDLYAPAAGEKDCYQMKPCAPCSGTPKPIITDTTPEPEPETTTGFTMPPFTPKPPTTTPPPAPAPYR